MTDIISHFLGDCFGSKGLILHGGTPVKKRQDLVDQFQDPNGPSFFVLSRFKKAYDLYLRIFDLAQKNGDRQNAGNAGRI